MASVRPQPAATEQEALPARYFETAAAGGVLVGRPPTVPEFTEEFGWDDAVIDAPFDDPDMPERITELAADPDRLDRIRRAQHRRDDAASRHGTSARHDASDVGMEIANGMHVAAIDERVERSQLDQPVTTAP